MADEKYLKIWENISDQVKSYEGVNAAQTDAFFSRLHLQAFAEGFVMLTADNAFIKKWIERQYSTFIKRALEDLYHTEFVVDIEVDELGAVKTLNDAQAEAGRAAEPAPVPVQHVIEPAVPVLETPATPAPAPAATPAAARPAERRGGMFSKMTFENYIIGELPSIPARST